MQILVRVHGGDYVTAVPPGDEMTPADGRNFDLLEKQNPTPFGARINQNNFTLKCLFGWLRRFRYNNSIRINL